MIQELRHGTRLVDEGDNPHRGVSDWTGQRESFIDACQQHGPQIARHSAVTRPLFRRLDGSGAGAITAAGDKAVTAARKGAFGARTP